MLKKITAIFIVISMISLMTVNLFAATKSELEEKKKETQAEKEEVEQEKSETLQEIEKLSSSIEDNEDKLSSINSQLITLNKEIQDTQKELEETQEKYIKQEEFLKEKLVIEYEAGKTTYLDVLLNSKGILEFISNYYLVSEVLQNDSDLLQSIEEQQNKIENNKNKLEEKKKEVRTQKAEQEKMNVILSNQKMQKQNKVSQLSEKEKKLAAKIDEYNAEIKRVEASIIASAKRATTHYNITISGSGILSWPLPYQATITSGFGGRDTGIPGASTYHRGIDIGVPVGTSVLAAADGYVVETGYSSVRGNYIMVKHGNNLYTFYQHLNSVVASTGSDVKKGQTIAYSGNTGIGSGPHLHFEVRTSANWLSAVNPLNYL